MHIENDPRRSKWASIISEFKCSGLSQSDFCKNNELKIKQFNYWFRKFKQENQSTVQPSAQTSQWIKLEQPNTFHKINGNKLPNVLNVKIGCATIEVQDGFNSSLLVQVIDTLRSIC